jgi:hypothetical protein
MAKKPMRRDVEKGEKGGGRREDMAERRGKGMAKNKARTQRKMGRGY